MADISDVNVSVIKDLYQRLEELDCKPWTITRSICHSLTLCSSDHDAGLVLKKNI